MSNTHKYLTRQEAAERCADMGLPIAPATLAKFVTVGGGPIVTKWGRAARYREDHLTAWVNSRLREFKSSSAPAA
jgi:hypothetical protein